MKKVLLLLLCLNLIIPIADASTAYEYILMDPDSGRVLASKNKDSPRLIASISKIMTCILVLENHSLQEKITVGEEILPMYGTSIYLKVGEVISVEDLLYGLMLRSGNDAAMVLANHTFSSFDEFVRKMNEKAKLLGMKNTTFENPHGLDDDTKNYSTAYDMALLGRYAYQNPNFRKIIETKKYTTTTSLKSYVWYNRMSLLYDYKNCIGGKNGYTPRAGKTLVSFAKKGDLTLLIVSLNDSDLYHNHEKLYDQYFSLYQNYHILDPKTFSIPSSFAEEKYYIKDNFYYPLSKDELDDVSTLVRLFPVTRENIAGKVFIHFQNHKIGEVPVYVKKEIKKEDISIFDKFKKLLIR